MTKVFQRVKHAHAMKGEQSVWQSARCVSAAAIGLSSWGRLREGGVQPGHTAKPALPHLSVCLSTLQPNL